MKEIITIIIALLVISLTTCTRNNDDLMVNNEIELWEKAITYLTPLDKTEWLNTQNISSEKIALGRDLFHDTRLSVNESQSCNTCHNLNTFGVDNKVVSRGHDGTRGTRNSPSVFNAVLHFAQFWDARVTNLKEQAAIPILNPDEMGMPSEEALVNRLLKDSVYQTKFKKAYKNENPTITFDHITDALAAFETTLVSSSRVDDYLLGDYNALNDLEKEGLNKFIDLGCSPCHSGQAIGGEMMHRFALQGYYWDVTKSELPDEGRYLISNDEEDLYVFKVPSLRNVEKTFPYFHDGSVAKLEEAVQVMAKVQLNYDISDKEIKAIVAFLNALTSY